MKAKFKKKLNGFCAGLVCIIVIILLDKLGIINIEKNVQKLPYNESINAKELESYEVIRVVDGDTFVIEYNENQEKVRLIGVDTPESVHPNQEKNTQFGKEVSNYSKEMLTGKQVLLEFDIEKKDKYGRLLAYVYVDGQMYNKMLLEKGYAKIATYPPNVKYVEDFTKIQKEARENKKGLWGY